jgi:hypothetical protein
MGPFMPAEAFALSVACHATKKRPAKGPLNLRCAVLRTLSARPPERHAPRDPHKNVHDEEPDQRVEPRPVGVAFVVVAPLSQISQGVPVRDLASSLMIAPIPLGSQSGSAQGDTDNPKSGVGSEEKPALALFRSAEEKARRIGGEHRAKFHDEPSS